MPTWVKCTPTLPQNVTMYVNLDNAISVAWLANRTRITFLGGVKDFIEVQERPEQIIGDHAPRPQKARSDRPT